MRSTVPILLGFGSLLLQSNGFPLTSDGVHFSNRDEHTGLLSSEQAHSYVRSPESVDVAHGLSPFQEHAPDDTQPCRGDSKNSRLTREEKYSATSFSTREAAEEAASACDLARRINSKSRVPIVDPTTLKPPYTMTKGKPDDLDGHEDEYDELYLIWPSKAIQQEYFENPKHPSGKDRAVDWFAINKDASGVGIFGAFNNEEVDVGNGKKLLINSNPNKFRLADMLLGFWQKMTGKPASALKTIDIIGIVNGDGENNINQALEALKKEDVMAVDDLQGGKEVTVSASSTDALEKAAFGILEKGKPWGTMAQKIMTGFAGTESLKITKFVIKYNHLPELDIHFSSS